MAKAKILGKLRGVIASAKEPSRNGRTYTEGFWDNKFNSDIFKEGLDNKVLLGELYHPDDEEEYSQIHCDDRSAIVLTDVKKQGLEYIGTFDILPTRAGQCLRNLLDIGCVFGVSSRGLADHDTQVFNEYEAEGYDLITWDIVALPGIKSCRLHEIAPAAEGFNSKKKRSKKEIMENLSVLIEKDKSLEPIVKNALKCKEDFDVDVQPEEYDYEDIQDFLSLDDLQYADIIKINKNGVPTYNDKHKYGKLPVKVPNAMKDTEFKPGDMYLVEDVFYDERYNHYYTLGTWLKLN